MATPTVEAVFAELQKIYIKLCEIDSQKLMLVNNSELFDDDGDLLMISPEFDPVGTDINLPIQNSIAVQLIEFNSWLGFVVSDGYILNPTADSDCEALEVCELILEINSIMASLNNNVFTPLNLSNHISAGILHIKNLIIDGDLTDPIVEFDSFPSIYDAAGTLIGGTGNNTIKVKNPDNDPELTNLQTDLNKFLVDILGGIDTTIRELSPKPPGGT